MPGDDEQEHDEEAVYQTYLGQSVGVPLPGLEPSAPPPPEPQAEPASEPGAPAEPPATAPPPPQELHDEPVYLTYVQPLKTPTARPEAPPPPPEPPSEPAPAAVPEPPAVAAAAPVASRVPDVPVAAPPGPVVPPPAGAGFENFEFRKPGQAGRAGRRFRRVAAIVVAGVGLAIAYPLLHPFGSSSTSSLKRYMLSVQPIALRAGQDRRSVQAAVNAVRGNPKTRVAAARRLAAANSDREALIRRLSSLGPGPGSAAALPARLTRLLRVQIQTGRVWQQWMVHKPFVYLKHDRATRTRIATLLRSQQASKGSFTRLYAQLARDAGIPLPSAAAI